MEVSTSILCNLAIFTHAKPRNYQGVALISINPRDLRDARDARDAPEIHSQGRLSEQSFRLCDEEILLRQSLQRCSTSLYHLV